jgi:hypothetical protein
MLHARWVGKAAAELDDSEVWIVERVFIQFRPPATAHDSYVALKATALRAVPISASGRGFVMFQPREWSPQNAPSGFSQPKAIVDVVVTDGQIFLETADGFPCRA